MNELDAASVKAVAVERPLIQLRCATFREQKKTLDEPVNVKLAPFAIEADEKCSGQKQKRRVVLRGCESWLIEK